MTVKSVGEIAQDFNVKHQLNKKLNKSYLSKILISV